MVMVAMLGRAVGINFAEAKFAIAWVKLAVARFAADLAIAWETFMVEPVKFVMATFAADPAMA